MKKIIILISLILCLFLLASCSGDDNPPDTDEVDLGFVSDGTDMFTERDTKTDYSESDAANITLLGGYAECSSSSVEISDSKITVKEAGTYVISGSLEGGYITVEAKETDKVWLVLDGANITSPDFAAIYIKESDKVFITLKDGSENSLSVGENFVMTDENNVDAAIFSKSDLTINGNGSLTVDAPATHGIVSKDDLVITGGNIKVTSLSHALDANDCIKIKDASLELYSGKDAVHAENAEDDNLGYVYIENVKVRAVCDGDGISASSNLQIHGGEYGIITHGGYDRSGDLFSQSSDNDSYKAIKAAASVYIASGNFTLNSYDDALHSNVSLITLGGEFLIDTGDDALHADETLVIEGGTFKINNSYEGLEALNIEIKGGDITIVADDDGINASGGNDGSGFNGNMPGGDKFGKGHGPGGMMGSSSSSDGKIQIWGGYIYMNASGDGIDANGSIEITGGEVVVCGPTQGDTSVLDYDLSASISGGTFIGTGAYTMAQTFSENGQGLLSLKGSFSSGTNIRVCDSEGNEVVNYTPKLSFQFIIISTPDMTSGEEYTVFVGEQSGKFEAQ